MAEKEGVSFPVPGTLVGQMSPTTMVGEKGEVTPIKTVGSQNEMATQGSMRAHQQDVEGAWDLLQRIATLWHSDHLTIVNFIQVDDMPSAAKVSEKLWEICKWQSRPTTKEHWSSQHTSPDHILCFVHVASMPKKLHNATSTMLYFSRNTTKLNSWIQRDAAACTEAVVVKAIQQSASVSAHFLPSHLYLKALLPGSCSMPVHLRKRFGCTSCSLCRGALRGCSYNWDDILTFTYLMRAFAGAPCSFRELHTGTAGKSQGRRKKKIIQPSAVHIAKRTSSGIEKEDDADDQDYSLDSEDKESRGQSKRKSLWAKLSDEVYEYIMLVKALSSKAQNGKWRQFNYIGGLLRDVDPVSMDLVLKAGKGGDPPSTFDSSPVDEPNELDFSDETIPAKIFQEDMAAQKEAGRWLEGLLTGDEVVTHEVFSYSGDVYLD
ncbi:unnamed protein product [Sphagnum compactum]